MSTWKYARKRGKPLGTRSCRICREPLTDREQYRCNRCKELLYHINEVHGWNWTNLDSGRIGEFNRNLREARVREQEERIAREMAELQARRAGGH